MSGFESHYDLYNRMIDKTGRKAKFIGLVSKLCGYLESDQIFDLYNLSRDNLKNNIRILSKLEKATQSIDELNSLAETDEAIILPFNWKLN